MANIKSQIKRNKQNEKRRLRNRTHRGSARTAVKQAQAALGTAADNTVATVAAALSALDRAAKKGAIHPRNASRRKSRLMKQQNKAGAAQAQKQPATKKTATRKSAAKKSSEK